MKNIFALLFLFLTLGLAAQEDATAIKTDLLRLNAKTTAEMNSMTRMEEGSMCYNEETKSNWQYIDSEWVNISPATSFATITGNARDNADLDAELDLKADDNNVMHLTGNETASGNKTFTGNVDMGANVTFNDVGDGTIILGSNPAGTAEPDYSDSYYDYNPVGSVMIGTRAGLRGGYRNLGSVAIGYEAGNGSGNTEATVIGFKANQGSQDNYGVTAIGFMANQNTNSGSVAVGHKANQYSWGTDVAIGAGASRFSYGFGSYANIAVGGNALRYNRGIGNVVMGSSFGSWDADTANAVTFDDSDYEENIGQQQVRITVPGHGFGNTDAFVALKYSSTGSGTAQNFYNDFYNGQIYLFLVLDANTLAYINPDKRDDWQKGLQSRTTHTLTPSKSYSHVNIFGSGITPDRDSTTYFAGTAAKMPNATISDIDAVGAKALPTVEWVEAQGYGGGTSMTPTQVKDSLLANADTNVLTDAEKAKQVYLSDVDDYIQQQLDGKAGLSNPYFVTPIHVEEPTQDDHAATRLYVDTAVNASNLLGIEAETASKTAELTDANGMVDFTSASDVVYTIPEDAIVAFTIGTVLMPRRNGAGNVSIAYSGAASGDTPRTYKYGESLSLLKTGTNTWVSINSPKIDYRYVQVMLSDLSTTLTTGAKKGMWIAPANGTIESPSNNGIAVVLDVPGTSTGINIDINKNGADIATTNLTTDATESSSDTAATDYVLSSYTFSRGDKFIFDIDAVPTGATGAQLILKVYYD